MQAIDGSRESGGQRHKDQKLNLFRGDDVYSDQNHEGYRHSGKDSIKTKRQGQRVTNTKLLVAIVGPH